MVSCSDNSLYTGITNNLKRRMQQHNSGKNGAKYTRSRRPVVLVYFELFDCRKRAAKREYALKKLTTTEKRLLIETFNPP